METSIKRLFNRPYVAFVIGTLLCWLMVECLNRTATPFDSGEYVRLAECFTQNGLFNFEEFAAQFSQSYRGYLFSWIIALCDAFARFLPFLGYRFWVSLCAAGVCTLLIPSLMSAVFDVRFTLWRRLCVLALFCTFYYGLLCYPLSDLWAAAFGVLAICALVKAVRKGTGAMLPRVGWGAIFGFALGAAYNIRTIYLLLFLAAPCLLALLCMRRNIPWLWKLAVAVAAVCGFALVSWPQMQINLLAFDEATFLLSSEDGSSLFLNQLYDGVYIMKYETFIDQENLFGGLNYVDEAGRAILTYESMPASFFFGEGAQQWEGMGDYFRLILSYPLDFLGIFARHFFNMVDIRYPEIYALDVMSRSAVYPALNYATLYLFLLTAVLQWHRVEWKKRRRLGYLALLLLPTLAIAAGAVETRFAVVLMLLCWGVLAGCISREMFGRIRPKQWVGVALGFAVFFCVCCAIGGATMACATDGWRMF